MKAFKPLKFTVEDAFFRNFPEPLRATFHTLTSISLNSQPEAAAFVLAAHLAFHGNKEALLRVAQMAREARVIAMQLQATGNERAATTAMATLAELLYDRFKSKHGKY